MEQKAAFSATRVGKLTALNDAVIVRDMSFDERITHGGIVLPNDDMKSSGIRPRWAQVYALGPDFSDDEITIGKYICIAHGRWTRGIDIEDGQFDHKRTIRKIDPKDILLVSDREERPQDDTMSTAVHVPKQTRE